MTDQAVINDNLTVPEKYRGKTVEDVIQMHQELERKLGERQNPSVGGNVVPAGGNPAPAGEARTMKAQLALQLQEAMLALRAGDPSAETKLNELGLPPDLSRFALGTAIDGQRVYAKNVMAEAGGPEAYKAILEWMADPTNPMSSFERNAFNADLESGSPSRVIPAVRMMRDRHKQETGFEPQEFVTGVPGQTTVRVKGYSSDAEMGKAFADKRYGVDEAYTAECQAKARVSTYESK